MLLYCCCCLHIKLYIAHFLWPLVHQKATCKVVGADDPNPRETFSKAPIPPSISKIPLYYSPVPQPRPHPPPSLPLSYRRPPPPHSFPSTPGKSYLRVYPLSGETPGVTHFIGVLENLASAQAAAEGAAAAAAVAAAAGDTIEAGSTGSSATPIAGGAVDGEHPSSGLEGGASEGETSSDSASSKGRVTFHEGSGSSGSASGGSDDGSGMFLSSGEVALDGGKMPQRRLSIVKSVLGQLFSGIVYVRRFYVYMLRFSPRQCGSAGSRAILARRSVHFGGCKAKVKHEPSYCLAVASLLPRGDGRFLVLCCREPRLSGLAAPASQADLLPNPLLT